MKTITYKFSRCFSLDMENGMSPSRLLEDKSLDQNRSAVREYSYRNIGMVIKDTRNYILTRKQTAKEKKKKRRAAKNPILRGSLESNKPTNN